MFAPPQLRFCDQNHPSVQQAPPSWSEYVAQQTLYLSSMSVPGGYTQLSLSVTPPEYLLSTALSWPSAEWSNQFVQQSATSETVLYPLHTSMEAHTIHELKDERGYGLAEFVKELNESESIFETPFYTWLIPPWLKKLNEMKITNGEVSYSWLDERVKTAVTNLLKAELLLPASYKTLDERICKHLNATAKRIIMTLNWAKANLKGEELDRWLVGLGGLAVKLWKNYQIIPSLIDVITKQLHSETIVHSINALVGLKRSGRVYADRCPFEYRFVSSTMNLAEILQPRHAETFIMSDQFDLCQVAAKVLSLQEEIHRNDSVTHLKNQLLYIRAFHRMKAKGLSKQIKALCRMIPVAHRRTLAFQSEKDHVSLIDFVKHDDGYVYGIKFARSHFIHADARAFRVPIDKFDGLIAFLMGDYGTFADIKKVEGVESARLNLKWYRAGKTPFAMIFNYLGGWKLGGQLQTATIWYLFVLAKNKKSAEELAKSSSFWLSEMEVLNISQVNDLIERAKLVKAKRAEGTEETEFFGILFRKLVALKAELEY